MRKIYDKFTERVESTGIDALCLPEKTGFWKRIFG